MTIRRKFTRHASGITAALLVWCFALGLPSPAVTDPNLAETPPEWTSRHAARGLLDWRTSTWSGGSTESLGRTIAASVPSGRMVLLGGWFAVNDTFDRNSYANDSRTQFVNRVFTNNLAWDFAQDVRGYDNGVAMLWVQPAWTLRLGSFQMSATTSGAQLAGAWPRSHGDQMELDLKTGLFGTRQTAIIRLLGYHNKAEMGRYRDALAQAHGTGRPPDIIAVRRFGATKYGFGLNFEQPLADGGATGLFGRWGWNDGATESFAFAEVDRTLSFGGQLSGAHWKRGQDRVGVALAWNGLSAAHRGYLAAGGAGLGPGDRRPRYATERVFEAYYYCQVSKLLALSLDGQAIRNPEFDRDGGPESVLSLRLQAEF
jgi:high affinity Mn2+ porin